MPLPCNNLIRFPVKESTSSLYMIHCNRWPLSSVPSFQQLKKSIWSICLFESLWCRNKRTMFSTLVHATKTTTICQQTVRTGSGPNSKEPLLHIWVDHKIPEPKVWKKKLVASSGVGRIYPSDSKRCNIPFDGWMESIFDLPESSLHIKRFALNISGQVFIYAGPFFHICEYKYRSCWFLFE